MTAALSARQVAAKRLTPAVRARFGQLVHQQRPHAPALPIVEHRDRHLGGPRVVEPHVARHADHLCAVWADSDERLVVAVIDLGEVGQVLFGEALDRVQEAAIARFGAQSLETSSEQSLVRRLDRADADHPAVG